MKRMVVFAVIVLAMAAVGIYGYSQRWIEKKSRFVSMQAKDQLVTEDGVNLAYDFYPATGKYALAPRGWLVLVHMMPATRESWRAFAERMQTEGFASIAFDLRGHGQSDGGPDGYVSFSDAQHQASISDLEAAARFLKNTAGAAADKIYLVGASIGANLSLQYLSRHPEITKAVLLSAGLDYRGVMTEPLARQLQPSDQQVLLISSRDDGDNAAMNERLTAAIPAGVQKRLLILNRGGHGTDLLGSAEGLRVTEEILNFLNR